MELQRRHVFTDARFHVERALTLAAVLLCAGATAASAQMSLDVSPLRVELKAAPGGTSTQAVTLTNAGKEPLRVRATLSDWDLSRDGAPQFESVAEGGPYSATAWVRVAPPEQIIEPSRSATVRFSLVVPQVVEPAGYRTGILFEFGPAAGDPIARGRQVMFRSRVATLIYVNVGEPPAAVDLVDLRSRFTSGQPQVIAVLKNTSRRTVRTKGTLTLSDRSGAMVRHVLVPDVPVLPESEREVAIALSGPDVGQPLAPGGYKVEVKIDVGLPALLVGETTVTMAATPPRKVPG